MTTKSSQRTAISTGLTAGVLCMLLFAWNDDCIADEKAAAARFHERVEPILETYCYGCHGFGERKGGRAFDEFESDQALVGDVKLWLAVLKNVRAGVMPPADEARPSDAERKQLFDWIERDVFKINPADPDPGRVTLRRLNRAEYRNTIRDLTGVEYDTSSEFPPDDSGYGFDNIGDAMSVSPLLMEKYLDAAREIVAQAVPEKEPGKKDKKAQEAYRRIFVDGPAPKEAEKRDVYAREILGAFVRRAYRRPVDDRTVDRLVELAKQTYSAPGQSFEAGVGGAMVAILASPRFLFRVEDVAAKSLSQNRPPRGGQAHFAPKTPQNEPVPDGSESADAQRGGQAHFAPKTPQNEPVPDGSESADERHPLVDEYSLASRLSYFLWSTMPDDELAQLAKKGELRATLAAQVDRMLKDPRSEALAENFAGQWLKARDVEHLDIDPVGALGLQHELDELQAKLYRLRRERDLRREEEEKKSDKEKADADKDKAVAADDGDKGDNEKRELRWDDREKIRAEYRRLRSIGEMFNSDLRHAMREETQKYFDYVVRENRNVMELVDSNYTFVNETLAKHYGIEGVKGDEMRRVELPADSPRGGVLTQATFLAVTSNPNRTSPVKRGLFILDNILGSPPVPSPPPNVPLLEMAETGIRDHRPTVRELQEQHRRDPLCHACHARMDPLGVALENFNALGMWRDSENNQPIDASGTLLTGEKFDGIRQLKAIIKDQHRLDFYRCLTEKLLTYSLGRGLEYYDEHTVDEIAGRLDREQGKFSALLIGIIESAPFQKQRRGESVASVAGSK